jgi:hypothetical protein
VTPAITRGPAAVVGGWTVAGHAGWVWLHQAWPAADGDLTRPPPRRWRLRCCGPLSRPVAPRTDHGPPSNQRR